MQPSPTAVVTRFTEPTCTSPAAKTPGMLDSKGSGARVSGAGAGRALASQLTSGADVAFRVALQHASQSFCPRVAADQDGRGGRRQLGRPGCRQPLPLRPPGDAGRARRGRLERVRDHPVAKN
jgi:hypothetical protein